MTEGLPQFVLDACVLVNYTVCDLLLRLAEEPQLYTPKWSREILSEATRTLEHKFGWPQSVVAYFESQVRNAFPLASVEGYDIWIPKMTNHPKDRHVVAAAVGCHAQQIVTFNLKHFKPADLAQWGVTAVHPQQCLRRFFQRRRDVVRHKLQEQADGGKRSLCELLAALRKSVPEFVDLIES